MKKGMLKQFLCLLLVCVLVLQPLIDMQAKALVFTATATAFATTLLFALGIKMVTDSDLIDGIRTIMSKFTVDTKQHFNNAVRRYAESGSDIAYISPELYTGFRQAVMEYVPTAETAEIPRGFELTTQQLPYLDCGSETTAIPSARLQVYADDMPYSNGIDIPFSYVKDYQYQYTLKFYAGDIYLGGGSTAFDDTVANAFLPPRVVGLYHTEYMWVSKKYYRLNSVYGYQLTADSPYTLISGIGFFNFVGIDYSQLNITVEATPPYDLWEQIGIPATIPITTIPTYHPATVGTQCPPIPLEGGSVVIRIPADVGVLVGTGAGTLNPADVIVGVTNPPIDPPIEPPIPPLPDFDGEGFKIDISLIKRKFPFSIPWDIHKVYQSFVAPPEAPKWEIPFLIDSIGYEDTVVIDLSSFDGIAEISRYLLSVIFLIGLILATRKIIG